MTQIEIYGQLMLSSPAPPAESWYVFPSDDVYSNLAVEFYQTNDNIWQNVVYVTIIIGPALADRTNLNNGRHTNRDDGLGLPSNRTLSFE